MLEKQPKKKKKDKKKERKKSKRRAVRRSPAWLRGSGVWAVSLSVSVQIIFGILTFRCWHEWKITKMWAHWTEQPCKKKKKKKRLVPLSVSSHRGLAAVFFFILQHPVCALTQIVGYVGNCMAEIRERGGPPRQSISASSPDVGRSTSESSRACSCWPACLLLWKRPRRPRSEGWSGSAGTETWSPGWGRSRARCRLAWAASWTLTSCSGTKSLPAGERGRA